MAVLPVRSSVFQRTQIGLESTPGTQAPANIRLPNLMFDLQPKWETKKYRGQGFKFPKIVVPNKKWSVSKYDGPATYGELGYIFSGIFSNAGQFGTYNMNLSSPDTPATYTVEFGDPILGGYRSTQMLIHDMTLAVTRDEVKVSGNGLGQTFQTGATLTGGPTTAIDIPILASEIDLFLDTSGFGNTKVPRGYVLDFSLTNRWKPNWVLDTSFSSWETWVEDVPTAQVKLTMESNGTSDAIVNHINNSDELFLRLAATGPAGHSMDIDFAVIGEDTGGFKDLAGVWVAEWNFQPVSDETIGFAIKATLT